MIHSFLQPRGNLLFIYNLVKDLFLFYVYDVLLAFMYVCHMYVHLLDTQALVLWMVVNYHTSAEN